jgi:tetratricopeptide (TPR) repeat protein
LIITGTAGVGKTALAVQWAQQRRDWFPDGQLYVNLRGYDSGPALTPGQALDGSCAPSVWPSSAFHPKWTSRQRCTGPCWTAGGCLWCWTTPVRSPKSVPLAFDNYQEALEWCETERANLVAATRQAARHGFHTIAWKLPIAIWGFFFLRRHWPDWMISHGVGPVAARHVHDQIGEIHILVALGLGFRVNRRYREAIHHLTDALEIARKSGDRWGEGLTWHDIGTVYSATGRFADAVEHHRQSVAICHEVGNRYGEAFAYCGLGTALHELDDHATAVDAWSRALVILDEFDDPHAAEVRAKLAEDPYGASALDP